MIEYLEQLKAERKWKELLQYAEQYLKDRENSPVELMRINSFMLMARLYTDEYAGAIMAGEVAVRLAAELGYWDDYGIACLNLGVSYDRNGDLEDAAKYFLAYLERLPYYNRAAVHEALVRFNLGMVYYNTAKYEQSSRSLEKAIHVAYQVGNHRHAHGIRQALISSNLKAGKVGSVPRLLAQCSRYLRHYPELDSRLWQHKLRAEFALHTKRHDRALLVTLKGLNEAGDYPMHQFGFHMLLGAIAYANGDPDQALAQYSAARMYAMKLGRVDFETEASRAVYQIVRNHPSADEVT